MEQKISLLIERLTKLFIIFAPSVKKDWHYCGDVFGIIPSENLENSTYAGSSLKATKRNLFFVDRNLTKILDVVMRATPKQIAELKELVEKLIFSPYYCSFQEKKLSLSRNFKLQK